MEVTTMRFKRPLFGSLALATILIAPSAVSFAPTLNGQEVQIKVRRVYDPWHKDYHRWDEREDRAFRGYFVEYHREYRPYERLKREERRDYWQWRHDHPDR
jgi:hypothetical protein